MVYIYRFFYTFMALLLLSPTIAFTADVDGDGVTDIFVYNPDTNSGQAYTSDGAYIGQVAIASSKVSSNPILFPGTNDGKVVMYSLFTAGSNQSGILHRFAEDGSSQSIDFGEMKGTSLMMYDINNDGNTDSIHVNTSGAVSTRLSVFTGEEQEFKTTIPRMKRGSLVSITASNGDPYLVVYKPRKKKKRTIANLYPIINGTEKKYTVPRKLKNQIFPHLTVSGLSFGHFTTYKVKNNGGISKFQYVDLFGGKSKRYKIDESTAVIPGFFTASGSSLQVFTVSGTGKVLDLRSNANLIGEFNFSTLPDAPPVVEPPTGGSGGTGGTGGFGGFGGDDGSGGTGGSGGDGGSGGFTPPTPTPTPVVPTPTPTPVPPTPTPVPTPKFGCNNVYPAELIEQFKSARAENDAVMQSFILAQLNETKPWCAANAARIKAALEDNTRFIRSASRLSIRQSASIRNGSSTTIITSPIASFISASSYNTGGDSDGGDNGGGNSSDLNCDNTQDGSDGAGGFVLKDGDHDGNFVILLPQELSTTEAKVYTPNGKLVQGLNYTGRSNGDRETYRGNKPSAQFPKQIIIRAVHQPFGVKTPRIECFEIDNAHIRND